MKKIFSLLLVIGFVLAVGTAYAAVLDPSKTDGYVDPETGVVTATAIDQFGYGSAAGGIGMENDTLVNILDPSKTEGYVDPETGVVTAISIDLFTYGAAAGGIGMDHDTFVSILDPSKNAGFVDPETGAITR